MTRVDALPSGVRSAARVYDNGEVAWRREDAATAIRALASARCVVLGLDFRRDMPDGGTLELPWSAHEPEDASEAEVRRAAERALDALEHGLATADLNDMPWVLITWWPPGGPAA